MYGVWMIMDVNVMLMMWWVMRMVRKRSVWHDGKSKKNGVGFEGWRANFSTYLLLFFPLKLINFYSCGFNHDHSSREGPSSQLPLFSKESWTSLSPPFLPTLLHWAALCIRPHVHVSHMRGGNKCSTPPLCWTHN